MELPGTVLFGAKLSRHTKFSVSGIDLDGRAVCWGVVFSVIFVSVLFFNNVYNLPQSLCLL